MKTSSCLRVLFVTALLAAPCASGLARPLFQEDFPTTTLTHYISGTAPHRGQFTDISAEVNGGTWTLVNSSTDVAKPDNFLQLTRGGVTDGAGISRRVPLTATAPGLICLRFDLRLSNPSGLERGSALSVEFGNLANTSPDYNADMPLSDLFGRMLIDLKGDGSFKLKLGTITSGTSFNYAADATKCPANGTTATISYYLNNSGTSQWFRTPDGAANYLSHNRCSVWIEWDDLTVNPNVHRIFQAVSGCEPTHGANSNLNTFRFRWTAPDTAQWQIDNVRIENLLVPSMLGFPGERLAEARTRVANAIASGTTPPAYAKLIAEAQAVDTTAEFPLLSVTQNNTSAYFPPGTVIDPRDYVSVGIYWWPPDSSHTTWWQNDGHPNYANEQNTDSGNFEKVCDAVTTLCWAYYLTPATAANSAQRTAYVQQVSALMNAWFLNSTTGMNPNLQHAGVVPFDPNYGLGNPAGIIDGTRLIELSDSIALIADSPTWTGPSQLAWNKWIKDYRTWLIAPSGRGESLMGNALAGPYNNNHTTWFDAQVSQYSILVGDYPTARKKIQDAHLQLRLPYQSTANGSEPNELARVASLDYSAFNAKALLTLALQGQYFNYNWTLQTTAPPSPLGGRALRKVLDFIAPYVSASPTTATATADWRVADPGAVQNQGERLGPREAIALGASIWYGTDTYSTYWSNIAPLLAPGAGYTHTSNNVTTPHVYADERWNLYLPPAP